MTKMDRVLFGDNQFFGINHMSEEKARSQAIRFKDTRAIIDVLDNAYDEGITTFMCTTHDRIAEICDHVRANPGRYADFKFYPCMPYAHKYANAMTDHGMLGAVRLFLPEEGLLDAVMRGGSSLARKEIDGIATLLIDAEMKMFAGLSTPVIFFQNVLTDFLLGLGFKAAFRIFARHKGVRHDICNQFCCADVTNWRLHKPPWPVSPATLSGSCEPQTLAQEGGTGLTRHASQT